MSSDFGIKVDLSGQIAMVTGASQGLGKACAVRLGQSGAKVLCVARNAEKLASTVEEIVAGGGEAEAHACDVANRESVAELFAKITTNRGGKLDILVNNAGITRDTLLAANDRSAVG